MKFVSAAIAASLLVSTPALADFTGPRAEVRLGLDAVGIDGSYKSSEAYNGVVDWSSEGSQNLKKNGASYGLGLGYDMAAGKNFVVGVEANVDFGGAKYCPYEDRDESYCFKSGRDIELAVRGGYVVTPATLLYAKLGYANGRFKTVETDGSDKEVEAKNRDGFRLGAGVETVLAKNVYLKVEYTYTDYKSVKHVEVSGTPSEWLYTSETKLGYERHKVVAGLGYRF